MAKKPNGEPFVSTVNFGTYYCALWRWDDAEPWRFLSNKTGGRREFPSASAAISETIRVKCRAKSQRVTADDDEFGLQAWRAEKDREAKEERERVFGAIDRPTLVFSNGRIVPVERRRIA